MEVLIDEVLKKINFEPDLIKEILQVGRLKRVKAGDAAVSPGSKSDEMPFVLEGLLKLIRQDSNGNEIFLYFLESGEACAMSITCCLVGRTSQFKLEAEEDSVLWMIPISYMDRWVTKYNSFRVFVFESYQARFDELLETIDTISFMKMDERLYKFLLDKKQATGSFVINQTHEQIARELNTSRVVVSRLLKQLEKQEKIEQYRNRIEIL